MVEMASISPPTSLASFSYPHGSSSKLRHVTLGPVHGSSEPMAVAAVQGDGVWTYDVCVATHILKDMPHCKLIAC